MKRKGAQIERSPDTEMRRAVKPRSFFVARNQKVQKEGKKCKEKYHDGSRRKQLCKCKCGRLV